MTNIENCYSKYFKCVIPVREDETGINTVSPFDYFILPFRAIDSSFFMLVLKKMLYLQLFKKSEIINVLF